MRARSSDCDAGVDALGIGERVRDRHAHVGVGELRDHRAVDVLDQRMHDALRVDHAPRCARRGASNSQRASITSSALVHHGRRVDRDLAAHDPVRMRAGLLRRHRAPARSSGVERNGPPEAVSTMLAHSAGVELAGRLAAEHWKIALCSLSTGSSGAPRLAHRRHEERPGHDQRFLVGEQHALAGARRGERRGEPGGADDRRHHGVDVRHARRPPRAPRRRQSTSTRSPPRRGARARLAPAPLGEHRVARPVPRHSSSERVRRGVAPSARTRGSGRGGARPRRACSRRSMPVAPRTRERSAIVRHADE